MKFLKFRLLESAPADGGGEGSGGEPNGATRTIEDRALEMGWIPPEEFRGDKSKFIPADEYVKRGENVMPVLKANNRRLEGRVSDAIRQNQVLASQLNEALEEIDKLKKGQTEASVEDLKSKRSELADELKIVREAGNTQREVEILGEINDLNAKITQGQETVAAPATRKRVTVDATKAPEYQQFLQDHPWYGQDRRKTNIALAIASEINEDFPGLKGKAFFDKVAEECEKQFGNPRRTGYSRVEGGSRSHGEGGGGGSGSGKTYADLPADAKAACHAQAPRLVGPGKKFKTESEWQAAYAAKYFE